MVAAAVGRAAVGRAACWVRICSTAGPRSCVSTWVPTRGGWSAPRASTSLLWPCSLLYDQTFYGYTLPGQSRMPGAAAVARGTARAAPQRAKVRAGPTRPRRRVRAACRKRPLGSATAHHARLLGLWPCWHGGGFAAPAYRPKSSIQRLFILSFYDGRLEALLDEVAHAGAAPVAASVKREIVRQHLQLQVFEAVPA